MASQDLDLRAQHEHLLEETRVMLPGMQALFGFQLIAVYSELFFRGLSADERRLHLFAIIMTVVSIGLAMSPATIHRRAEPDHVSDSHIRLAGRMLTWSLLPLAVAFSTDLYLLSRLVLNDADRALGIGLFAAAFLGVLWFVLPWWRALKRQRARDGDRAGNKAA